MIEKELIEIYKCTCRFCRHKWKAWELPDRCGKCKKPGWNKDQHIALTAKEINVNTPLINPIPDFEPKVSQDLLTQIMSFKPKHSQNCKCFVCVPPKGT